jgi:ribosomal-protein-alanine N-acetyltransferase
MSRVDPAAAPRVRILTSADLDDIMMIEESSFTAPWRRSTFESLLARHDSDLLGALDAEGHLIGYAVVWTIVDQAELGNVAVAPQGRSRGAGRALVREALARARARGARECFLEVRESNEVAKTLYDTLGFTAVGRRRRYYSNPIEDALVMRVEL